MVSGGEGLGIRLPASRDFVQSSAFFGSAPIILMEGLSACVHVHTYMKIFH